MSKWIKKGDKVLVIAGNNKGKSGEVLSRSGDSVIIQDVNMRKKHMKRTEESQGGRIIEIEMPIHISNVSLCDKDGKRIKLRCNIKKDGSRELVYGDSNNQTVYRCINKG